MRMVALVFWFFLTSSLVLLFYQYRESLQEFFTKLQEKNQDRNLWEHPFIKWPLRFFLILTIVAWIDMVVWGITSVLPLALFLLIVGGKNLLKEGIPYLLLLSAFWIICRLLFGSTPAEFLSQLNAEFLWKIYGVSPHIMQPLIIPLVVLFTLGIASLIFRIRIFLGIGAILFSTTFPFLLGFLFGDQPKGIESYIAQNLSAFYHTTPEALKISLLPQAILFIASIILLVRRHVFGGFLWMSISLLFPFLFSPAQIFYASFMGKATGNSAIQALSDFYAIPPQIFKILVVIQIVLIIGSFILACHEKPFLGLLLFLSGFFLPWAYPFSQKILFPFIKGIPDRFPEIARLYGLPEKVFLDSLIFMFIFFFLGFFFITSKKTSLLGVLFIVLGVLVPWLSGPVKNFYSSIQKQDIESLSFLYQKPSSIIQSLIIPMSAFFFLGILAILKKHAFWGSVLVLIALFLPWIFEPMIKIFSSIKGQPEQYFQYLVTYYQIDKLTLAHYAPAMLLLSFLGFTQLILKKRNFVGLSLLGMAIYLPFWWPFAFIAIIGE